MENTNLKLGACFLICFWLIIPSNEVVSQSSQTSVDYFRTITPDPIDSLVKELIKRDARYFSKVEELAQQTETLKKQNIQQQKDIKQRDVAYARLERKYNALLSAFARVPKYHNIVLEDGAGEKSEIGSVDTTGLNVSKKTWFYRNIGKHFVK